MNDPDEEVRNNAVRALAVLTAVPGREQLQINVTASDQFALLSRLDRSQ
jgi:hypothetical protein